MQHLGGRLELVVDVHRLQRVGGDLQVVGRILHLLQAPGDVFPHGRVVVGVLAVRPGQLEVDVSLAVNNIGLELAEIGI